MRELDRAIFKGDSSPSGTDQDIVGLQTASITETTLTQTNKLKADEVLKKLAALIDGKSAISPADLRIVTSVGTNVLWMTTTLRGSDSAQSAASYMALNGAGFGTSSKMPAKVGHIQQGILCRKGQPGQRLAVAPTWGSVEVDDIYTDAKKGLRNFTVSVLVGDVIVQQPAAYSQVAFRVST